MSGSGHGPGDSGRYGPPPDGSSSSFAPPHPFQLPHPSASAPTYAPYPFLSQPTQQSLSPTLAHSPVASGSALQTPSPARTDSFRGRSYMSPIPTSNPNSATDISALSAMYAVSSGPAAAQTSGETGLPDGVGSPAASTNTGKVVQKADRSCKKCRERRVRCDRAYPACARCRKRREECVYSEGVYVETIEEGSDQAKIAELEAKVASLETQLKSASNAALTFPPPLPPLPAAATTLTRENLASIIGQTLLSDLSPKETTILHGFLNEQDQSVLFGTQDLRSAANAADVALTCLLLDASTRACCTKLPGLQLLRDRLPYYKANLHALDPPCQLVVVTLCAIGARVIPNSALFGVPSITFSDGTPSAQLFLAVGTRREKVCQALQATAIEASWASGVLRERNYDSLDSLLGLVQVLIHEEGRMQESRFFVRQVVGMFIDLRHEEMAAGAMTKISEATTTAVYVSDAFVSSTCDRPSFITPADLDYFVTGGLRVPDLVTLRLSELLEEQLRAPLSRSSIVSMLTTIGLHVFSCHRVFAQVSNPRRPGAASILPFLRNMWTVLDQIHNAIQRLQQHLVNLASPPAGYGDDPHAVDHAILLAVRADNSLVDLIMLIHVHLSKKRGEGSYWPEREGNEELERMRSESSMRVFKCLKLLAFYCQLYIASQDKHNVFHLLLRLEALPDWTTLVSLRIGAPGGPVTDEFELTQEELDWFRSGLELTCFYSPRGAAQLQALAVARQSFIPPPFRPPSSASHLSSRPLSPAASQVTPVSTPASNPVLSPPPAHLDTHSPAPLASYNASLIPTAPFPLPQSSPQPAPAPSPAFDLSQYGTVEFAIGAADDLAGGSADVRSAFRSTQWDDLSLTPAMGMGSDGSSNDGEWKLSKTQR
ncbi:hypothetical protein JCM1840_001833 [Sporobolomyces johnsonii]